MRRGVADHLARAYSPRTWGGPVPGALPQTRIERAFSPAFLWHADNYVMFGYK
jgi:hypothetical protein